MSFARLIGFWFAIRIRAFHFTVASGGKVFLIASNIASKACFGYDILMLLRVSINQPVYPGR